MKRYGWHSYVYLGIFLFFSTIIKPEGVVLNTPVHTHSGGYTYIQNLATGEKVVACAFNGNTTSAAIVDITCHEVEATIRLEVDNDVIELAEDQLVFVPLQCSWLSANQISKGMYLLGGLLQAIEVKSITRIEQPTQTYALSLNSDHNYLVGQHGVVVHNFGEVALLAVNATEGLTFLNAFLVANPLIAPVTIGVGGIGLVGYLAWTFMDGVKKSKSSPGNNSINADCMEDKNILMQLLTYQQLDGTINFSKDPKDPRKKWWERLMELMDQDFSKNTNNMKHIIRAKKHGFHHLLQQRGYIPNTPEFLEAEHRLAREIQEKLVLQGRFPSEGQHFDIRIVIDAYEITVEGRMCNGIPRIGTAYIESLYQMCRNLI